MPSPRSNHRKVTEEKQNRPTAKGRLSEKSMSFHGQSSERTAELLRRPRTVPDLLSAAAAGRNLAGRSPEVKLLVPAPKLTKLLLNVTIQRSTGPVQVLISPESTVQDLIAAAINQYSKEGRRPVLSSGDRADYDLHYSQFSLESLNMDEKLMELGSRNFFMCPKKSSSGAVTTSSSSCAKQAETATSTNIALPWLRFMDFLL